MELKVLLCRDAQCERFTELKSCHLNSVFPPHQAFFWSFLLPAQYFGDLWVTCYPHSSVSIQDPSSGEGRRQNLSTHQGQSFLPWEGMYLWIFIDIYGYLYPSQLRLTELMLHSPSGLFHTCNHFTALSEDPAVTVSLLRQHRKSTLIPDAAGVCNRIHSCFCSWQPLDNSSTPCLSDVWWLSPGWEFSLGAQPGEHSLALLTEAALVSMASAKAQEPIFGPASQKTWSPWALAVLGGPDWHLTPMPCTLHARGAS